MMNMKQKHFVFHITHGPRKSPGLSGAIVELVTVRSAPIFTRFELHIEFEPQIVFSASGWFAADSWKAFFTHWHLALGHTTGHTA